MRMAFRSLKKLPENFRFIADGYSAYPLAAQQFYNEYGDAQRQAQGHDVGAVLRKFEGRRILWQGV